MADSSQKQIQTTAVVTAQDHSQEHSKDVINPEAGMVLFTWICFFALLAVLQKFAWKPILRTIRTREDEIGKSLEDAEKIRREIEQIDATCRARIEDAEVKAKAILEEGRKAAREAAQHIQDKARNDAQIQIENAQRQIREEKATALAELRKESARIATQLAGKILQENIDSEKNDELVSRYLKEIST